MSFPCVVLLASYSRHNCNYLSHIIVIMYFWFKQKFIRDEIKIRKSLCAHQQVIAYRR